MPRPEPPARTAVTLDELQAIAERSFVRNQAHSRLGSFVVSSDRRGVTVGLRWDEDRFGPGTEGVWPHGALVSVLDQACALAVVMGLGDTESVAGSVDLRIDYLWEGRSRTDIEARGEWVGIGADTACARAVLYHPGAPDAPLAVATSAVALVPA